MHTDLIDVAAAAKRVGRSEDSIRRWVRQGKLHPAIQYPGVTGKQFFRPEDVDALLIPNRRDDAMAAHPAGADLPEGAA